MSRYSKLFASVDEQIALLKCRGMGFHDEQQAAVCLSRVGYYRLSAYWYPFRQIKHGPLPKGGKVSSLRADHFAEATSFKEIFDFYVFDKKLRLIVTDALERIEIGLRAALSDVLAARDPWAHRDPDQLDGKFARNLDSSTGQPRHMAWLRRQDSTFAKSKEDFAVHFRAKYPLDTPPMWIAREVWDWGMLSHLFAGMKIADKDKVAAEFGKVTGKEFETWIRSMNDIRNICAHHGRLWNKALPSIPRLPAKGTFSELDHIPRSNPPLDRLYPALVLMRVVLRKFHPVKSMWHTRLIGHVKSGPTSPLICLNTAGFPPEWDKEEVWL